VCCGRLVIGNYRDGDGRPLPDEQGRTTAETPHALKITLHHSAKLKGQHQEVLTRLRAAVLAVSAKVTRIELLEQLHETRTSTGELFAPSFNPGAGYASPPPAHTATPEEAKKLFYFRNSVHIW